MEWNMTGTQKLIIILLITIFLISYRIPDIVKAIKKDYSLEAIQQSRLELLERLPKDKKVTLIIINNIK